MATKTQDEMVQCECGRALGERCAWSGPRAETVVVEWMPEHLRASHAAAGNRGVYPRNGAWRLRVHRDCGDAMRGCLDPWGACGRQDCPVHGAGEADDWAAELVEGS